MVVGYILVGDHGLYQREEVTAAIKVLSGKLNEALFGKLFMPDYALLQRGPSFQKIPIRQIIFKNGNLPQINCGSQKSAMTQWIIVSSNKR